MINMNDTVYIDHKLLLGRIHKIVHETTRSKEHAIKTGIEESVLRSAFGVKSFEFDDKNRNDFPSYLRKQVNTDSDIINQFNEYIEFYNNLDYRRFELAISIKQYIQSVRFFNEYLADQLYQIAKNENIQGI